MSGKRFPNGNKRVGETNGRVRNFFVTVARDFDVETFVERLVGNVPGAGGYY